MVMKSRAEGDAVPDGQTLQELDNNTAAWVALKDCYILYAPPCSVFLEFGCVRHTVFLTASTSYSHRALYNLHTCRFVPSLLQFGKCG